MDAGAGGHAAMSLRIDPPRPEAPISGSLEGPCGRAPRRFTGWVGLVSAIRDAVADPDYGSPVEGSKERDR